MDRVTYWITQAFVGAVYRELAHRPIKADKMLALLAVFAPVNLYIPLDAPGPERGCVM